MNKKHIPVYLITILLAVFAIPSLFNCATGKSPLVPAIRAAEKEDPGDALVQQNTMPVAASPQKKEIPCDQIEQNKTPGAKNDHRNIFILSSGPTENRLLVFLAAVFAVLAVGLFLSGDWRQSRKTFDLFDIKALRWLFGSRLQPNLFQAFTLLALIYVLYQAFFGPLSSGRNPGTSLLWGLWWPSLVLIPLVAGRFFCSVCPISFFARAIQRFANLGWQFPARIARLGLLPAAALFILFGIADQLFLIEHRSWVAGQFLLLMVLAATLFHVVFRQRAWCTHLCPIGAVQTVLSRLAPIHWGKRETSPPKMREEATDRKPANCSLGLNPLALSSPHQCSLCGDCWHGRENKLSLQLHAPAGHWLYSPGARGESFLILLLLAHLFLEHTFGNDIGQLVTFFYERAFLPFDPTPALPNIIPVLPLHIYKIGLLLFYIVATFGGRALLIRLFRTGSFPLTKEQSRIYALSLLPLVAAAFLAFHIFSFAGLADLVGRFISLLTGHAWTEIALFQARDFPIATIRSIRIITIAAGFSATIGALMKAGRISGASRKQRKRRFMAEAVFALLVSLFLIGMYFLPNTSGDPC